MSRDPNGDCLRLGLLLGPKTAVKTKTFIRQRKTETARQEENIYSTYKKYVLWNEISVPLPNYNCYVLAKILQPLLVPNKPPSLKLSPFATSDMIGCVTIGFVMYSFLWVVNFNQPLFSHSF